MTYIDLLKSSDSRDEKYIYIEFKRLSINAISTYTGIAVQICVLTAFSDVQ